MAVDRITATLVVTNGTTNGQTFTVNGNVRTWTNVVSLPASHVLTNNAAIGAKTNLYNAIALVPFSQVSIIDRGSNSFDLVGASGLSLTVSPSAGWASLSYSTQTVSSMTAVRVPVSAETAGVRTNVASGIVSAISGPENTNQISQASTAVAQLLGTTNAQTISGAKQFNNSSNTFVGTVIAGAGSVVTNTGNTATLTIQGNAGVGGQAQSIQSTPGGLTINTSPGGAVHFSSGVTLGGDITLSTYSLIGTAATISDSGIFGTGTGITNIAGTNILAGTIRAGQISPLGLGLTGTNTIGGDLAFVRYALSSLADGNNAGIIVGTNTFVEVSGPTNAFTINGIAGGRDGKYLMLLNQTGQNMTVAHQSGTDPTAANRIITLSGADRVTTGNGAAILIYSGAASRWILFSLDP